MNPLGNKTQKERKCFNEDFYLTLFFSSNGATCVLFKSPVSFDCRGPEDDSISSGFGISVCSDQIRKRAQ